ncbi:phosphoenolpyruvate--protein phosphotransferase [Dactylosporangium matsuzakiense]|uniref:Phosphoenolpyruvate-protein phosphotransferase n=1 Tax=Dactylosporangium matsuzakiense TaxID=53360 RepID=A0A9W6KID6_9ACTN|nr:phosphoenolpyruvate--protein phosphotransferase [Dactylosporangium matsuzakiense]UWZ48927.1 phosphoenolpyruvate--protein phosphotransferase [Dactylosporangium matsuzakiense]GLL00846.1 phosphoenolpyruvate-protein phosphotransferase [Dactylosporangium matsuzakiense]
MPELRGIGVSPGRAAGPVLHLAPPPALPAPPPAVDADAEKASVRAAVASVAAELERRAEAAADPTVAEVLRAQVLMATDEMLVDAALDRVDAGASAPHALADALAEHRAAFEAAGGYLAERVADLDDLRDRMVAACLGLPMPGIPAPGHPFILAARDLAPADTAGLDPAVVLALVTAEGGPTSHTAILARTLGIPAVVRCGEIADVADASLIAVDGRTGTVTTGLSRADADAVNAEAAALVAGRAASHGPGQTADGHPVALLGNIGSARDLTPDVEGVGLFRTELLYLDRADAPTEQEQVAAYTAVFAALPGKKVVVRTLDAGADKPLPFLRMAEEPNPALGVRGLRIARRTPAVLATQLAAIATAAAATEADVWVMAPMVATAAEAAAFTSQCRAHGLPTAGVMIEVPAAALRAPSILRDADFLSLGTNDLSQYTFAADRMCGDLAELLDPWQPALIALIAACATAGQEAGKPVGVCGESAADPDFALVLAGLGITSLSMAPRSIPAVREALAAHTLEECRQIAKAVLAADTPEAARAAVRRTSG